MTIVVDNRLATTTRPSVRTARSAEAIIAYALAAPALLLLLALFILPVAAVFVIALTDWQLGAVRANALGAAGRGS